MISTTVFPGRYIQGYDALKSLGKEIVRLGSNGFFICSPTVYSKILPGFLNELDKSVKITAEKFGGECSDEEIERERTIAEKTGWTALKLWLSTLINPLSSCRLSPLPMLLAAPSR